MSNKRIRIKRAKFKKSELIKIQAFEVADSIIKLNACRDNLKIMLFGNYLNELRIKHIEQIREVNEIIKYGKLQLKGCRVVSAKENILNVKWSGEDE